MVLVQPFFLKFWNIVGPDITSFVLLFLNNGVFDSQINFTHVILISKYRNPSQLSQFRQSAFAMLFISFPLKCLQIGLGLYYQALFRHLSRLSSWDG